MRLEQVHSQRERWMEREGGDMSLIEHVSATNNTHTRQHQSHHKQTHIGEDSLHAGFPALPSSSTHTNTYTCKLFVCDPAVGLSQNHIALLFITAPRLKLQVPRGQDSTRQALQRHRIIFRESRLQPVNTVENESQAARLNKGTHYCRISLHLSSLVLSDSIKQV